MVREGLARTLEREPGFKVIGQCSSSAEALELLHGSVDMALLDVDLGEERGLAFVEAAKRQNFEGRILVVTAGITVVPKLTERDRGHLANVSKMNAS